MKYIDEFSSARDILKVVGLIKKIMAKDKTIQLMEVCGTHTQAIFNSGLRSLIPGNLRLISGPGCPVCVSDQNYIDSAVFYSHLRNVIVATFGDMLRVPGGKSSLEKERAKGADVRVVYSTLEALKIACENPLKKIIFLGVGFETTAPTIALSILMAKKEKINNYFVFSSLKLIPPAMEILVKDKRTHIQGYLCPGHVSAIIGSQPYNFIAKKYNIPCVIAGFQPLDVAEGIFLLLKQIVSGGEAEVVNQYKRVVKEGGNPEAKKVLNKVFKISDSSWRGIGIIPKSGLEIKEEFERFDARKNFKIPKLSKQEVDKRCLCGEVIKGIILPRQCTLFARQCTPLNPLGPCMVASEGTCGIYYKEILD